MAQERIRMPSSTAGITRYFDEYRSKFEFKPGHVIVMAIGIAIIALLLHTFGGRMLGP